MRDDLVDNDGFSLPPVPSTDEAQAAVRLCEKVVDMTEASACATIEKEGLRHAVVKRNGRATVGTRDYRTDRVKLDVEDYVVVAAKVG